MRRCLIRFEVRAYSGGEFLGSEVVAGGHSVEGKPSRLELLRATELVRNCGWSWWPAASDIELVRLPDEIYGLDDDDD